MKSFVCLLGLLFSLLVSVHGQYNYLIASHDAAMQMKALYDHEVQSFRDDLTQEAYDMGTYFGDLVFDGISSASTAAQGAAIQHCSSLAAADSRFNIQYMDRYIVATQEAANALQYSVTELLSLMNIKEQDLELFYYYHNYLMEDAFYELYYVYRDNMFYSWFLILIDFFYVYDDLYECIDGVLAR